MEPKNEKKSSEISASQAVLKKMIPQLLISVSLFSFMLSYSSSLLHSSKFHYYFSANSFELLSNALNKNCIFLICNGLLVFLAKTSGFVGPPSGHDLNEMLQNRIGYSLEKYHVLEDEQIADHSTNEDEQEEKSPQQVSIFIAESDLEKDENELSRSCWLFDDDDDQEQVYDDEDDDDEDEDDDDDDEEKEEMSTEELNKKIEDFIRRMKEEIIINEARRKVVLVE